jgi:hypothetical protein
MAFSAKKPSEKFPRSIWFFSCGKQYHQNPLIKQSKIN